MKFPGWAKCNDYKMETKAGPGIPAGHGDAEKQREKGSSTGNIPSRQLFAQANSSPALKPLFALPAARPRSGLQSGKNISSGSSVARLMPQVVIFRQLCIQAEKSMRW